MIYISLVAPGLTDSFAICESSPEIAPGSNLPGGSCAEFAAFVLARSLRNSWENEESERKAISAKQPDSQAKQVPANVLSAYRTRAKRPGPQVTLGL